MKNKILKKTFLILFILLIAMIFTMNISSASSEEITNGNGYNYIKYDDKYYTFEEKTFFKVNRLGFSNPGSINYYSLKLKNSKENPYKLNSARISYYHYYGRDIDDRENRYITLKSKDKSSLHLKFLNHDNEIFSATVSFTKNGKKGTTNLLLPKKDTWTTNTILTGKTARVITAEKGYSGYKSLSQKGVRRLPTTYNKIKIDTKSSKYLIKSVKVYYLKPIYHDIYSFTFKGNGKATMTITTPYKYLQFSCFKLKVNYY
jgi:hypothetical protein